MGTILLVEDSKPTREMMTKLLTEHGSIVDVANDGIEALSILGKKQFDIVVLDIIMPKMNGYEVCRRIKSDPKIQATPVLICSSKGEEFDRYWGMKQGADAYIAKPFQPKELISTIKQLLRK
jgi:twitching motility two-component system response regulator PilH